MKTTYKNLKELQKAVTTGELEAERLEIVLDNDHTGYYYSDDSKEVQVELTVESAGCGYDDYYELYKVYFPNSNVERC